MKTLFRLYWNSIFKQETGCLAGGTMDLQTFMDIVLHVVGHTDPLSPQPVSDIMQKPLSTHCHNISRHIRQMTPQFQKIKPSFQLVCVSQPLQVESMMCYANLSSKPVSPLIPKQLSIQFLKSKEQWFHAAKPGHVTSCKRLISTWRLT